ncbi:PfkB family carbohydrate kinase [Maribellus mangrovi]|uniref:PfkB family carbohydrate kinase n=1 Tax=Maribellus mangrovi TaxID=3133146 RepID=UPI0030EDC272
MHYKGLFFGLTTIDIQYFVDRFPETNKKLKTDAPDVLVGGPAANAAVAFSYLNNGAHLVSAIGESAFSSFIRDDFANNKLQFTDLGNADTKPVIASVVTSSNGDRNIFTHYPEILSGSFVPVKILDQIQPEIILMDGFYSERAIPLAKKAFQRKIPIVLDCGSWKPQYNELLKYTDTAICSADFQPPSCKNSREVFRFLRKTGVKNRVITQGEEDILFEQEKREGELAVEKTKVIDTLGAGDFFHGAFCYYTLKMRDFEKALNAASQVATFSCKFKGTRAWLNQDIVVNV